MLGEKFKRCLMWLVFCRTEDKTDSKFLKLLSAVLSSFYFWCVVWEFFRRELIEKWFLMPLLLRTVF